MTGSLDRRQFLNRTAVGASLAAGVAVGSASAASSSAERVTVGVMGLSRGKSLAQGFAKLSNVQVKYLCDVDETRAASAARSLEPIATTPAKVIGDFRRILEDKEVDALVCAAPNHWHGPATILACAHGKHVYVEKPCSHNPAEGELMIAAARKHKRAVQVGTQRRSGDGHATAMKLLKAGAIGRVYLSKAWYTNLRPTIGKGVKGDPPAGFDYELWQGPAPRLPYHAYLLNGKRSPHYNWHWRWHFGNGELGNNGVHTLDLCRWGLGADFPIRVTSSGGRYCFADEQQTPDTHTVCYEFAGGRQIIWHGTSCNKHTGGFVSFYGTDGALDLDSNGGYTLYDLRNRVVKQAKGSSRGDTEHLQNLVNAVRNEKPLDLAAEIAEGHKSTLLCHLGNIAHRTGRTLNCSTKDGRILADKEAMRLWRRDYEPGWEPHA